MKFDTKRIDWLTIGIAVVVLLVFGQFTVMNVQSYIRSTVTLGEVVKLNHGGYHPQVEFITDQGDRISFPGSSSYPVEVGDRLEVRYERSHPRETAQLNQLIEIFAGDAVMLLIVVVFTIAGLRGKSLLNRWPKQSNE